MTGFSDVDDLSDFIRANKFTRIAVDGVNGVGKTTLAKELATRLGYHLFCLDNYLEKNKGSFVDYLQYPKLMAELDGKEKIIIEGVCLLDVLHQLEFSVDCFVYVKRLQHGVWADERECEIEGDVEQFIKMEKETVRLVEGTEDTPEDLGLAEEIIRYHASSKPHLRANATYYRNDC